MAQPARMPPELDEPPVFDDAAVARAYRLHRARRSARLARRQARSLARVRFWLILGWLLLGCLVLSVTIWVQVRHLFGI
jgi:hypothetical protein